MENYAGKSHDERVAAQEQPGGEMAVPGTMPDESHSCGELSEAGKRAWRQGNTIGGKPEE